MIRVAYHRHIDPRVCVERCVASLGMARPDLVLAFCGGKLDPDVVLPTLRDRLGGAPVYGGAAAGAITREAYGYSGLELLLVGFQGAEVTPRTVTQELGQDEEAAGRTLGAAVREVAAEDAVVVVLYDSVASRPPLRLHPASRIVRGFHEGLGGHRVCLLGGGLLTDMNLSDGWVFDGERCRHHLALALVFPPGIEAETVILHGCRPVSTFMEITRIDGAEVYELDGMPALGVIERMLGLPLGEAQGQELSLLATLGQKQGDPFAPYDENAYVNRLILRANPETGSVTLFEPDFELGAKVQIMGRDNSLMLESVTEGIAALNEAVRDGDNLLALYIDCAGRASARSGAPVEEAELVLRDFAPRIPFAGFYSGVEIAPFQGYSRPLDWTGVLSVLRRRA
ncbi:FIST C-terminal domain-containing protein [Roseomonas sp. OT10]|uniref:FIST signal transduction protein n=1 Tax=Roseomonas cutis TaxID=2897332 RepID=UPI001E4536E5|nr:FIST N-terminal domain-containing protein [Roseomonas sp. OT10]UFN50285.1 FIST C-terminal domain-containing protein [Roseomonas sp. OT10]